MPRARVPGGYLGAMPTPSLRVVPLLLLLVATGCDVAQHSEKVQTFEVVGVVEGVLPEEGTVIIDHEDIPDFMPGMTMSFDVPNAAVLGKMAEGQKVSFTLQVRDRSFRIVDVRVLEQGTPVAGRSGRLPGGAEVPERAAAFTLVDQEGRTVRLADFAGKTLLLDFIYTHCPGPCPILTGVHVSVQDALPPALRDAVHFVSISLDPERDTPDVMKRYAEARGVDLAHWSMLGGERDALEAAWLAYGVGSGTQDDGEIEHLVVTFLIDGEGNVRRRFLGVEHSAESLLAEIERIAS